MSDASDSGSSASNSGDDSMSDNDQEGKKEVMSMEEGCCICDVSDASGLDPLVYCDVCNLAVHKLCYGIERIPDDDWYCNTCIYWKKRRSKDPLTDPNSKPIRCCLCDRPKGAMKELYRESDKWAHMVCALFIDEVYFHDTTNSNGIIIDRVPPKKRVGPGRKCHYCDKLGFVVNCQCGEKDCNKKFHITCAQERHQLLMTDNSALAIESDRSTEFKVLCSAELVNKMKERNQQESEKLKRKRERAEEEKRKLKDKVPLMDPEKKAKMDKLKKLQKITHQVGHNQVGHGNQSTASSALQTQKSPSHNSQVKVKREPKIPLPGQKRKSEKKKIDSNGLAKQYDPPKLKPKKPKICKEEIDEDLMDRTAKSIYSLYDTFEKESDSYDGGFMSFEAMVDLLKDQGMTKLIEPCRKMWAFRAKQTELQKNYRFMKNQRQLMEKQILIQNQLLNNLNGIDSGFADRDSPDIDPKLESEEPISPTSTLTSSHSVPLSTSTSTTKQENL